MAHKHADFQAIGTQWDVTVYDVAGDKAWHKILHAVQARIATFDRHYSRFRADSLVSQIAGKPGRYALPPDGYGMLDFYHRLYQATGGRVTPLIGQTMADAGYDASYSLQKKQLHQPPRWEEALAYDEKSLTTNQPVLLDFGAAGKGYLVDIVGEVLEAAGVQSYCINAGGDIRYRSEYDKPLEVGLENPQDTSEAIGIAKLASGSLCASAGSKRKWSGLNHIIDPVTLQSPSRIMATWVMAGDTMTADGLATALFFTEPRVLAQQFSFSYALLSEDMQLRRSHDFPVTVFEAA